MDTTLSSAHGKFKQLLYEMTACDSPCVNQLCCCCSICICLFANIHDTVVVLYYILCRMVTTSMGSGYNTKFEPRGNWDVQLSLLSRSLFSFQTLSCCMCVQCLNFLEILFFTYLTLTLNFVIFFPVGNSVLLVLVTATTGLALCCAMLCISVATAS